jgi:hypothetical protein
MVNVYKFTIKTMPKYLINSGKQWSSAEEKQLAQLASGNTPTRVIGLKLGRSESSVYNKASELGVSLNPPNQSPYNRKS